MNELSENLKRAALEMGFSTVGISPLTSLEEGEKQLQEWIAEGRHGSMKYLENFRERRADFFKKIPNAKNVIVLGVNYFSNERRGGFETRPYNTGKIARYAWGKDYHEVIQTKHAAFLRQLKELSPNSFTAISCIDTKPLLERAAGVKAGLGFVGKNTMLLSKEYGPWLFLSEIVTDLDLAIDDEAEGDCGRCVKCQVVCPTGALDEDYRIDARKCIAYLTIEHKGVIDRALRPQIKDWVFGCDECLSICPFTAHQKNNAWTELRPESGIGERLLFDELFGIKSNREHEDYFKGSAILRANRKQLMRNACIVLGNSKSKEAIPYLKEALADPAPLVRLHAAWALGALGFLECGSLLKQHLQAEEDPEVIEETKFALETNRFEV